MPDYRQSLLALVAAIGVAHIGCGSKERQSTADPYDRAMKRLVAEQKQLDWIDEKIDKISLEAEQQCQELETSARELVKSAAAVSPQMHEEAQKSFMEIMGVCQQIRDKAFERSSPLREQRTIQLNRVEAARQAADEASEYRPNR